MALSWRRFESLLAVGAAETGGVGLHFVRDLGTVRFQILAHAENVPVIVLRFVRFSTESRNIIIHRHDNKKEEFKKYHELKIAVNFCTPNDHATTCTYRGMLAVISNFPKTVVLWVNSHCSLQINYTRQQCITD